MSGQAAQARSSPFDTGAPAPYPAVVDVEVTIRNYRCFSDTPVRFPLSNGLQAFVGVNNSGKSCLLRFFYELRTIFASMANPQAIWSAMTGPQPLNLMPQVKDRSEIFCDRNKRDLAITLDLNGLPRGAAPNPSQLEILVSRETGTWLAMVYAEGGAPVPTANMNVQTRDRAFVISAPEPGRLRPLVNLTPLSELGHVLGKMVYIGPFRNAVNIGGAGDYYDIQIGQPFITQWRQLKTGYQKRESEATYRLTEDIRRIFGFGTLDINASDDGQNLQLMIDGKSYKQSEIGSGLIQFILVLVNAAVKGPSYVLIDEPESNLHPSLQIDFLTTLASYASHGVLFATHNLGLARAVSDRVYSVRCAGNEREVRDFSGTKALAEFLGEMGFNSYQDLGFETVLLVEGPTDVTCVQQLLRLYRREHQVVLLQLGGASMINGGCAAQLTEVTRISQRVYAMVDSERSQAAAPLATDRKGFAEVCEHLKIPCCVLERRAIENYFPEHAIRSTKGEKYRALGPYERLKDVEPAWGKEENWRIARLMTDADLKGTDLGDFLAKL